MLDSLKLQAFIDGECSSSERREILEICEKNPVLWRKMALAFVEEQQFAKQIGLLDVSGTIPSYLSVPSSDKASSTAVLRPSNSTSISELDSNSNKLTLASSSTTPGHSKSSYWRMALAASLAGGLLFVGGAQASYLWFSHLKTPAPTIAATAGDKSRDDIPSHLASDETRSDHATSGIDVLASNPVGPTNNLSSAIRGSDAALATLPRANKSTNELTETLPEVLLPNAGTRFRLGGDEIPMYRAEDIHPSWILAKQAAELQHVRAKLNAKGYDVQVEPTYISGELEDGRYWVIPINEVGIDLIGQ